MTSIKETITGVKRKREEIVTATINLIYDDLQKVNITKFSDEVNSHPSVQLMDDSFTSFVNDIAHLPNQPVASSTIHNAVLFYEQTWSQTMQFAIDQCQPPLTNSYVDDFHDKYKQVVKKRIDEMIKAKAALVQRKQQ